MTSPKLGLAEVPQAILTAAPALNAQSLTLDAVVQLGVKSRIVTAPPTNAVQGDTYIIPTVGATGTWTNRGNHVAYLGPAGWLIFVPRPGWLAWSQADAKLYVFDLGLWTEFTTSGGGGGDATNSHPPRGATFTRGNTTLTVPVGDVSIYYDTDQTIVGILLLGDESAGDCVVDIWVKPLSGGYPPTNTDSIFSSGKPTLSGSRALHDTTLTGTDVDIPAGSIARFHLDSVSGLKTIFCYLITEPTPP